MDIQDLTIRQVNELKTLFVDSSKSGLNEMIGKKCIIRTCSAGVWFGEISEKSGNEVIVKNARRMWKWWAAESISLSAVSIHGIIHDKSKICEAVDSVWLEAIELIPCEAAAITSIEGAENVKSS